MKPTIIKTPLSEIQDLRVLFLQENNFQFIYDKCHLYGWADTYLFILDGVKIGYGSIWGSDKRDDRDTIFEFFILKQFRKFSGLLFSQFYQSTKVTMIEAQTNDLLLSTMLYEYAKNVEAEAILFEDAFQTDFIFPAITFRKRKQTDEMGDDDSDFILEKEGRVMASGGLMLNYNMPYADIYMQVKEPFRRQGMGSLIVQELKKQAYVQGRVPAARCNIHNSISKSTLLKAGFKICGFIIKGTIANEKQPVE